jgi:succinyl-CoA synthetase beta subunit
MNIHEHQAKELLAKFGVNISRGHVIYSKDEINNTLEEFNTGLYVIKAQIHAGGRGKVGGVKLSKTKQEAKSIAHEMWGKTLITKQTGPEGQIVNRLYIEEGCDIKHEYYLSMVLDRAKSLLSIVICKEGGVDIEEIAEKSPEKIMTLHIDPTIGLQSFHCRKVNFMLGLGADMLKETTILLNGIYKIFTEKDAEQIEINPLVLTANNKLIALDAKISFDNNALFRHKDIVLLRDVSQEEPLETKAANYDLSYVKMDGNIGCMVNGAGLAMATMDIIKLYGAEPANFLDVGGGADKDRVIQALKIILSDHHVEAILVNIFGGIMRCDIIADGIIAAAKEVGLNIPLVVRLAGTNFELGKQILANSGLAITAADDLADAAKKIVEIINNKQ